MQVISSKDYNSYQDYNTFLAIGAFDGLHQGHQLIIKKAVKKAEKAGCPAGVLSFYPHPQQVIPGKTPPPAVISRQQKIDLLAKMGVDYYFEQQFTPEFAGLKSEIFVEKILVKKLKVKKVIVGDDFRFGSKNEGNVEILQQLAELNGFETEILAQLQSSDERISSTRIRRLLKKGKLESASKLLGRPYQICGQVIHGKKRGRKLGFPTANLKTETNYTLPPRGVYAVKVYHEDQQYLGAANLGYNPTFKNKEISFEIYLLDFEGDLYGERLCVDFFAYIRGEKTFNNVTELSQQMKKDVLYTRKVLC
ncbi:bifunctional riboflavin kinase/FAD synthetase [Halanaerobium salsuginis]|uniref:Riboflavin biosynthesis protein n=1 Tax=Halanaerobium salsuginis TaxID=29563 RepID=A0A1I4F829_9FIRM|nr:bifunctional riboflavin kinase/FAD synthetase [Halanaerobium salsuginis]SFL14135.1 riboflavin kinase / FMN adenylyltransferase [Halanaerobium salsuginis]